MAATAQAQRLTEAHRLAQAQLGARVVIAMRAVWPLLDPADLDGTFERWLNTARLVIDGQRVRSARLAANYLAAFRAIELGVSASTAPIVLAEAAPPEAVTTSMLVTGPNAVKVGMRLRRPLMAAADVAQARSAAAAMRHVLDGGRQTIAASVAADPRAAGWARVTSGEACEFCSMLASRGAVYSDVTAHFESHDGCSCSAEPVYT